MSSNLPTAATASRIHLDRGALWRASEALYLAQKIDPVGGEVDTANLYRLFGHRQADWYDDQLKALNGVATGELDTPGQARRSVLDPAWAASATDTSVDWTSAFQAAIDAVELEGGGVVYVPPLTDLSTQRYRLNGTVTIRSGVTIQGGGPRTLLMCRAGALPAFQFETGYNRGGLRDLVMLGNDVTPAGIAIRFSTSQKNAVKRVQIWDFATGVEASDGTAFSAYNLLEDVEINRCTAWGIRCHQSCNGLTVTGGRVFYTFSGTNTAIAVDLQDCRAVAIDGLAVEAYDIGLRVANSPSFSWHGGWMEKGANDPPGTNRRDFVISSYVESTFFEGTPDFRGVHHTDQLPAVLGSRSIDKLAIEDSHLEFRVDYVRRWRWVHLASNNIALQRWAAGVIVDTPFDVSQSNGVVTMASGASIATNWVFGTTALTIAGASTQILLGDATASGNAQVMFRKGDANNQTFMAFRSGATGTSSTEGVWSWQHDSSENINFLRTVAGSVLDTPLRLRYESGTAAGRSGISVTRYYGDLGTAVITGDFALSAGWGTTASVSAIQTGSRDTRGRITVTSSGTGQAANPTIVLTFHDGAYTSAPFAVVCRSGGSQRSVPVEVTTTSTTMTISFIGTPVAAETYVISYMVMG